MVRPLALALTVLTGFTALAYEVAWQRYLATLLGAHSEATAAVLAIFLGGLSLGYRAFGALSRRLVADAARRGDAPPLLALYGLVEGAIGVYALLFPWLFRGAQALSLALPTGGGLVAFAADVALAAALVAPPAVLMGATIPILTQALARDLADATRLHSLVYAFNTAGAFAGALAAGFALVPWWGLDGLARAMGALNVAAGAAYLALGRLHAGTVAGTPALAPPAAGAGAPPRAYAIAALLVGFAAMTCQTALIRVGALTLGSSQFTFAMVVAAFVSAIALGSLAVAALPRIPRALLPATLWATALAFGALYAVLDEGPYWGHVLRSLFRSHEEAFHAFHAAALLATLAVVGPAAALSGAALPLLFHAVREEPGSLGDRAGRLYGQNTLGSLLGALLGGYALLIWLDLHHVYRIALAAFAGAAALVTARLAAPGRSRSALRALALAAPALLALALLPPWRPERLAAGLFRTREPQPWTYRGPDAMPVGVLRHYEDDPNSSVAVREGGQDSLSILVNGKSDGNTVGDLQTMALAALVPALFAEQGERAFVIGFGTGITAGYLAELEDMQRVTVAEISSGVLRAAPHFDAASFGASHHPKLELVRSDAYRALLRSGETFDVIVSEPSNPWTAGVEMLYSREFLRTARDHLTPGGVYVQWYHAYETSPESVALVLQTYAEVFERVAVWHANATDLLLLGFAREARPLELSRIASRAERPDFARLLRSVGIGALAELLVHERWPVGVAHALPRAGLAPHTLVHPRLAHLAARGFFTGGTAELPFSGGGAAARVGRERSLLRRHLERFAGPPPPGVWDALIERACATNLPHCATLVAAWSGSAPRDALRERLAALRGRTRADTSLQLVPQLRQLFVPRAEPGLPALAPEQARRFTALYRERYYHAFPFSPQALLALWERCREDGAFATACREGRAEARALVSGRATAARGS